MMLFQPISEILTRAMLYITAHRFAYSPWIGSMTIGRHSISNMAADLDRLFEKPPGRFHIPHLAHHGINQIAIVVNRSIHLTPLLMHFDVGFVNIPGSRLFYRAVSGATERKARDTSCCQSICSTILPRPWPRWLYS